MVKLSPPRFYFEINLDFKLSCIISIQNFSKAFMSINVIIKLKYAMGKSINILNNIHPEKKI